MANQNTTLVVGVVAAVGITAAFIVGYYAGAGSYTSYGMMGQWFWPGIRTMPGSMMGPGMMTPGGGPGGWQGSGGWGGGMMGPGMMGPGMMGPRQAASQNTVVITNYSFYPDTLTVKKGTTVTWINMDPVPHTAEAGTHEKPTGKFESSLLGHMESFSYTFNEPGTYVYHCDPHPYMTGKIVVEG